MIDRSARDTAVTLLRDFRGGTLTNRELEAAWPEDSEDPSLPCILQCLSCFHSADAEQRWDATTSPPDGARLLERCQRFLASDRPYAWPLPANTGRRRNVLWLLGLVLGATGLGLFRAGWLAPIGLALLVLTLPFGLFVWRRLELRRFRNSGDFAVWPFTSVNEAERSLTTLDGRSGEAPPAR